MRLWRRNSSDLLEGEDIKDRWGSLAYGYIYEPEKGDPVGGTPLALLSRTCPMIGSVPSVGWAVK